MAKWDAALYGTRLLKQSSLDIHPQTAVDPGTRILPDREWVQHRLSNLWLGGTLT